MIFVCFFFLLTPILWLVTAAPDAHPASDSCPNLPSLLLNAAQVEPAISALLTGSVCPQWKFITLAEGRNRLRGGVRKRQDTFLHVLTNCL